MYGELYIEQILEAAHYKTAVIQPLTYHLENNLRWDRHAVLPKKSKDLFISNVL